MLMLDVNVCVYAFRRESRGHGESKGWLEQALGGRRPLGTFRGLVSRHGLRGYDIPDAYLAALALEQGATWVANDRGFARYEGLRLLDPLAT